MERAPARTIALALLVTMLAAFVVTRSFDTELYNHDIAWLLHGAGRILDGARYGEDFVEVSPPSILWLTMMPAAAARAIGWPPILAFNLFVLGLALVSSTVCGRILRAAPGEGAAGFRVVTTAGLAAILVLVPGFDFGQREHLLVMLASPYLFAAAAAADGRPVPRSLGMIVGLLAAAGFALKPHFLLLWLAVEAYVLRTGASGSWRRTENVVIAVGQLIFAVAVLVFTPEYPGVVRMALQVYGAYDVALGVFVRSPAAVVLVLVAVLFAVVRPTGRNRRLRDVLLLASTVLFGIAVLQGKGFTYHLSASLLASSLLAVVIVAGPLTEEGALAAWMRPAVRPFPLVVLGVLLAVSGVRLAGEVHRTRGAGRNAPSAVRALAGAVAQEAGRGYVLALSTSLHPLFPAVELAGAGWTSRFGCLWPLPGSYSAEEKARRPFPYHAREEMGDVERSVIDDVVADMRTHDPVLIVVDATPVKQGFGPDPTAFDFLDYFTRDGRFAAMLAAYRHVGDIGPYRFYRRGDGG